MRLIAFDFPFYQTGWKLDHGCQFRSCQVIKNVLEVQGMEVGEQTLEAEAEREAEAWWVPSSRWTCETDGRDTPASPTQA